LRERSPDFDELVLGFAPPFLESSDQPAGPESLARLQVGLLLLEPSESHLGVAAPARCRGEVPQAAAELLRNSVLQEWPVGPYAGPQSSQRDTEVVQRLGVFRLVQPAVGLPSLVEEGQREKADSFLNRSFQEIKWKIGHATAAPYASRRS
jgi:hypothetical protein